MFELIGWDTAQSLRDYDVPVSDSTIQYCAPRRMRFNQAQRLVQQRYTRFRAMPGRGSRRVRQWDHVYRMTGHLDTVRSADDIAQLAHRQKLRDCQLAHGNQQARPQQTRSSRSRRATARGRPLWLFCRESIGRPPPCRRARETPSRRGRSAHTSRTVSCPQSRQRDAPSAPRVAPAPGRPSGSATSQAAPPPRGRSSAGIGDRHAGPPDGRSVVDSPNPSVSHCQIDGANKRRPCGLIGTAKCACRTKCRGEAQRR